MTEAYDIEVIVFDVLGTMVDEPGGLRAAMREAAPASEEAAGELCADRLLNVCKSMCGTSSVASRKMCGPTPTRRCSTGRRPSAWPTVSA